MSGIILAVAAIAWALSVGGIVLFFRGATAKPLRKKEPAAPQGGHSAEYVTLALLEERLSEHTKRAEWLLDEWYEKFSTLHARLAKRQQRAKKEQEEEPILSLEDGRKHPRSALPYRRLGSV